METRISPGFWVVLLTLAVTVLSAGSGQARSFQRIETREQFVRLVDGVDLRNIGVTLRVQRNGAIRGSAFGRRVGGSWSWKDGFFCRTMQWGDQVFPLNCQTVRLLANTLRFTSDEGRGDSVDLRMR